MKIAKIIIGVVCILSVSYTHLDVYKRQFVNHIKSRIWTRIPTPISPMAIP